MPKIYGRHTAKQRREGISLLIGIIAFPFLFLKILSSDSRQSFTSKSLIQMFAFVAVVFFFTIFSDIPLANRIYCLLISVSTAAIAYKIYQHQAKQEKLTQAQALNESFHQLVTKNQGTITLFEWTSASKLPKDKAQEYLNTKAVEWDAKIETNENQVIVYKFPL